MTTPTRDTHRTILLSTRLNADEHALLLAAAASADLPPSTYLRNAALALPIVVRRTVAMAPEDVAQVKRLGNLLNQIARAGWRGRFAPPTEELFASVLMELRITLRKLTRAPLER